VLDEDIAEPVRKMRIYYHCCCAAILSNGLHHRTAASLSEAWPVGAGGRLAGTGARRAQNGRRYDARLRLRLDTAQLPSRCHRRVTATMGAGHLLVRLVV